NHVGDRLRSTAAGTNADQPERPAGILFWSDRRDCRPHDGPVGNAANLAVRGRWGVVGPSQQLAGEFNLRTKPPTSEVDIKDRARVGGARLFFAYSMVARWLTMFRAGSTISPQRSRILGCHWSWLTRQSPSRVNFPPMKSSELPRPEALCRKVCAISPMGL